MSSNDIDLSKILNKKSFDALSDEEKQITKEIISELQSTGESNILKEVWKEDYEEIPVSIDEFLEKDEYLGKSTNNGKSIYPFWRETFRNIFDGDNKYDECLSGDTLIPCLDGTTKSIKDIVSLVNKGESVKVYSYDIDNDKYVVGEVSNGKCLGYSITGEISLDNDEVFRCTYDHKLLMSDNKYKKLIDLSIGDKIKSSKFFDYDPSITSIELYREELVYDIEVSKYHNFSLSSGVISKNCIFSGGIGLGKTTVSLIGICYILYKLLCLKNPQEYYGLVENSKIVIAFFNTSLDLSYGVAYAQLQSMLQSSSWFRSHGEIQGIKHPEYVPGKGIKFRVGSQENHGLGQNIFCLTGDTRILTTKGEYSLKELSDDETPIRVISIDDNDNIIISNLCLVKNTGLVNEIYEITFEDGTILRCTGDHKLLKSSGKYSKVEDLIVGDDIKSINIKESF